MYWYLFEIGYDIGSDGSYEESDSASEKMDALDAFLLNQDADLYVCKCTTLVVFVVRLLVGFP